MAEDVSKGAGLGFGFTIGVILAAAFVFVGIPLLFCAGCGVVGVGGAAVTLSAAATLQKEERLAAERTTKRQGNGGDEQAAAGSKEPPVQSVAATTPTAQPAPTTEPAATPESEAQPAPPPAPKAAASAAMPKEAAASAIDPIEAKLGRPTLGYYDANGIEIEVMDYGFKAPDVFNEVTKKVNWSYTRYFTVVIEVRNRTRTKKVNFVTWASPTFPDGKSRATLTDEYENQYARIVAEPLKPWVGNYDTMSIRPGEKHRETLIFEQPIEAAKLLNLAVPLENIGIAGDPHVFKLRPWAAKKPEPAGDEEGKANGSGGKGEKLDIQIRDIPKPPRRVKAPPPPPDEEKVAGGKLRTAKALEADNPDAYRRRLEEIVAKWPKSQAGEEAAELLKKTK